MLLAEAMYSCGEKSEILPEVLRIDLIFRDGEFTDLPLHIKLLLDNLQAAFTSAFIEASGCQLPDKEDGDSSSTKTESESLKSYYY